MDFSNEVIVVVGSNSDLALTLIDFLIKKNAKIIGTYHDNKSIKNIDYFKCDIAKEEDVINLFNYVYDKYKKIDAVINMASISIDNDYLDKSKEEFMKVVEVNLLGTYLVMKYASLKMNKGVIINMSSNEAQNGYRVISMDYDASKAGIENLTKNFAKRLPNLKICAISPRWINTFSVMEMEKHYLENELKEVNQEKLLTKEEVALKIIEVLINNDDYISSDIINI